MPLALRIALACLALTVGCVPGVSAADVARSAAVTTANSTRLAIETAESTALGLYRADQVGALESVRAGGGNRDAAVHAVDRVRVKWQLVWTSLDVAEKSHRLLVAAIQAYDTGRAVNESGEVVLADVAEVARRVRALADAEQAVVTALAQARGPRP